MVRMRDIVGDVDVNLAGLAMLDMFMKAPGDGRHCVIIVRILERDEHYQTISSDGHRVVSIPSRIDQGFCDC